MAPADQMSSPTGGETVSFSARIQSIFDMNCIVCHRTGGLADREGIRLRLTAGDSLGLLVNQPSTQRPELTLVVPGDSGSSLLFQKVSSDSPPVGSRMPLFGSPLSSSDVSAIRDWIDQGALDN